MKTLRIVFCFLFCSVYLWANNSYLNTNTMLYKDASKQLAQGELIVATSIKVLSQSKDMSQVEFIGFAPEESPIIYEKLGELKSGYITQEDPSLLKVIGEEYDEYDTKWLKISVVGFVDSSAISEDKQKILEEGKNLFTQKCSTCHALHHKDEFDISVWPSILDNMGPQSGLSNIERMTMEKYLQER